MWNLRSKLSPGFDLLSEAQKANTMKGENKHEPFCCAGQPAPCKGYFPNDVLPCVCGTQCDIVTALSRVAVAAPLGGTPVPAGLATAKPESDEEHAAWRAVGNTEDHAYESD
jgi:hypothetical protein